MNKKKEYRMYGFVPYNISPIQQGIQFGHAVVEYANKHCRKKSYIDWANNDKTFIILNGGTTRDHRSLKHQGSMQEICRELDKFGITYATFREPDLNNALTGIVFLVESEIFNFDLNSYIEGFDYTDVDVDFVKWLKSKRLA